MTHQITKREDGSYGIERIASGCVYGSFDTFAQAMQALCESKLADQLAVADRRQY